MLYNIVTVFLMTTALMPPAILQYYAFEPLLKHRQKVLVLGGYAVLYLMDASRYTGVVLALSIREVIINWSGAAPLAFAI